ncbi:ferritin [Bacteroidota bacterium]
MLNKRVQDALNKQINAEFWSAYYYLSMSAYFTNQNLPGFANWMRVQFQEETSHALKLFDYVGERGGEVILKPIAEVKKNWKGPIDVFKDTFKHEQKVTSLINDLMNIALEEKDHATVNMLQWFVDEQVEEEANVDQILNHLQMVEGKGHGLFMLDNEFKSRVFVDATQQI